MSKSGLTWCVFILCCLVLAHGQQGITFVLREDTYTLNDIVTITDIGVTIPNGENNGLRAHTTHRPCCQTESIGVWYLPGVATPLGSSTTADFSRSRTDNGEVILSRRNDATDPTGIYRCNLPDNTGTLVDVYIGIYLESTGAPTISPLMYDVGTRTLTCVSGGGPATTVTWRKNCSPLTIDGSTYSSPLPTVDTATTTYTNTLTIGLSVTDIDGVYSCEINNRRGRVTSTVGVGADYSNLNNLPVDVTITPDLATLTAGQPLTMNCSQTTRNTLPQSPVTFQWLDSTGAVLSDTNTLSFTILHQSHQGEYYCVATVGALVGCAEYSIVVQDPTVMVTINSPSGNHGEMVTLTCSASGIDLTGATYSFFDGDKQLAGPGSSNTYSLIADLATAGGDYYCELTVNPEYLDVSGPLTVRSTNIGSVSVTIPPPPVSISFNPTRGPYYTGQRLVISCVTGEATSLYPGTTADISLTGPSGEVMFDSRITDGGITEPVPDALFIRAYTITTLSKIADDGSYTCMGTIRPEDPSIQQYVTNGVNMATPSTLTVVDPTLDVQVTMVTDRILDIAPYNSFSIDCTAISSVQGGVDVDLSKTFTWTQIIDDGSPTMINDGIVNSGLDTSSSTSQLTVTTTTAGQHTYSCNARISLLVSDVIINNAMRMITVQGPAPPLAPVNLMTSGVTNDRATIQWTVPSVAYDRETFVVMFGNDSSFSQSSSSVMGRQDITLANTQYIIEITGLDMNTQYYYRVQSTNTDGSTTSMESNFNTTSLVPGVVLCMNRWTSHTTSSVTVTWSPPVNENGVILMYVLRLIQYGETGVTIVEDSVSSMERNHTLTGGFQLTDGVPYTVEVYAENSVGRGRESCNATDFNVQLAPPPVLGLQQERTRFGTAINITWTIPTLTQARGFVRYIVTFDLNPQRKRQTSPSNECSSSPCDAVSVDAGGIVLVNVDPARAYQIRVLPTNEGGGVGDDTIIISYEYQVESNIGPIVGGVGALLVVIVIAATIIIVTVLVLKRQKSWKPEQTITSPGSDMMTKPPGTIQLYEMTEVGHEYEDPNKLQDAQYETICPVSVATKEEKKEGFDYTQCSAYAPTSTGGRVRQQSGSGRGQTVVDDGEYEQVELS